MSKKQIFLSEPTLGEAEAKAAADVVRSGWITTGPKVEEFEETFAAMHKRESAVAVSSCTAGLHLALLAAGIGPGDEVIVPSLTFVATANAVRYCGATPVLVDVESPGYPILSETAAEAAVTDRTRGVIVMHYAGYLCDMSRWKAFCDARGLALIEDAAHAVGLAQVGDFSDSAVYSFFGNKNITTGEGGMVTSRNIATLDKIRSLRTHAMSRTTLDRRKGHAFSYDVTDLGFNYRIDEIRAAIGLVQLGHLSDWNDRRRELLHRYRTVLPEAGLSLEFPFKETVNNAAHIAPLLLPAGTDRESTMTSLREVGVHTSIHYPPIHTFSAFKTEAVWNLPATDDFASREMTIPLHPQMTDEDVQTVCDAVISVIRQPKVAASS